MNTLWLQRPAGGGRPAVIALHAGVGSPEDWRPLAERLRYRVLAPHLNRFAATRARGTGEPLSLDAEAALIEPLVDAFQGPVYLAGHDYGAAVAIKLWRTRRERIAGLVLYEPKLFGLLLADPRWRRAALDIAVLRRVLRRYLDAGDGFEAARRYVDHWWGADAWQGLGAPERAAIARHMPEICAQIDAEFADPMLASEYAGIDVPVLLLTSPRMRASTQRIAEVLARTLPRAEWRQVDGAGHRGIDSHPEAVDREIETFLPRHPASWHRDPEPTAAFGVPVLGYGRRGLERTNAA